MANDDVMAISTFPSSSQFNRTFSATDLITRVWSQRVNLLKYTLFR